MRKLFRNLLMLVPFALGMASCVDNSDNPVADTPTGNGEGTEKFDPEVLLQGKVYLAEGLADYLKQAFEWGVSDVTTTPEDDADFVLVAKLTDVSEDYLKQVYSNGGVIAVLYPDAAELEAYRDGHDWLNIDTKNVESDLMLFAFNNEDNYYYIKPPLVDEGFDPILLQMMAAEYNYIYIASMLNDVMEYLMSDGTDDWNDMQNFARATAAARKAPANEKAKMEDFAGHIHEHVYQPFLINHTFRQLWLSDPDEMNGTFSMNTEYDIYTVHVYEGEAGAGDYYGVKMTATISSGDIWKGKGWNKHGGTYVRWCGAYTTDFYAESHLTSKNSTADADWIENTNDRISFTANGSPSPETTVGKTTYEDKNSFSLSMSHSIGGKLGTNEKGNEAGLNIDLLSVKEGWEWSHSEKRDISDVDILNEQKNGNWARWHLVFNNLPVFKWSEDYGFDVKNNQAARSSMSIHGVWLWYDKTGKDNETKDPYALCTWMRGDLAVQSFITTYADHQTSNIVRDFRDSRLMPSVINTTGGYIKLKNDLPNDSTISNVVVSRADNGKKITEFENTIPNGGEQVLGFFNSNHEYMVTFKGKSGSGEQRNYKYTLNPTIKVSHKQTTTVYAKSDFDIE